MFYSEVEDSLTHFGVLGMKWGHRKAGGVTSAPPSSKAPKVKMSRREKRVAAKKFYEDRATTTLDHALKNPDSLIGISTPAGRSIVTGKEFTSYLTAGGAFHIKAVDVYASRSSDKTGPYVVNDKFMQSYAQRNTAGK